MDWKGVMPAITTFFDDSYRVDHNRLEHHCDWLLNQGCSGVIALGTLGEGATLTFDEKLEVLRTCVRSVEGRAPVVAGISALSTPGAVELASAAADLGCNGLMILPPYVYKGDWPEMKAHISAVLATVRVSCMLYNNPIAYGTDIVPEQMAELRARHHNFHAVKESSGDIRRITSLKHLGSLAILVGMDDVVVESVAAGATGWIAGLVNAFPEESVRLFHLAQSGTSTELDALYSWFLPLLRLDTVPKFVQLIKQVQEECGGPSARVRPPRLELIGAERDDVVSLTHRSLTSCPR